MKRIPKDLELLQIDVQCDTQDVVTDKENQHVTPAAWHRLKISTNIDAVYIRDDSDGDDEEDDKNSSASQSQNMDDTETKCIDPTRGDSIDGCINQITHGSSVSLLRCRRISFHIDAVFQSCVLEGDNVELWKLLCNHGSQIDIDSANHLGVTPLHHTVLNNNLDGVKILLSHGCEVNLADSYGFTPLHTASACGFLSIASLLLVFGADVFLQTSDGDLPADLGKNIEMIRLLQNEMLRQINDSVEVKDTITDGALTLFCLLGKVITLIFNLLCFIISWVFQRLKEHRHDKSV